MTQQLNYTTDNFDTKSTFAFEYKGFSGKTRRGTGYLFNCEQEKKIYIMKKSVGVQSSYTEKEINRAIKKQRNIKSTRITSF